MDVAASAGIATLFAALAGIWLIDPIWRRVSRSGGTPHREVLAIDALPGSRSRRPMGLAPAWRRAWPAVLFVLCLIELLLHIGDRNPFVATSRPTANVETWTTADGYAMLMDGMIAQADGNSLLGMVGSFLGDREWEPTEFDRRAGHVYFVSLLVTPLGAYWSFAAVNFLAWWAAAVAVFWLGCRRWPGTLTGEIGSILTATGLGFIFMGAAPQAHAAAYGAFAISLALCDRLLVWHAATGLGPWTKVGWAAGAGGLLYLVHIPAILFIWLYGWSLRPIGRVAGLVAASVIALGVVTLWERLGVALLGMTFSGGNNDLAGEAMRGWSNILGAGAPAVVAQLHEASPRGLLVSAFYYPWWALAAVGLARSTAENRRWSLAVIVAAALPALAFSTRFQLPRLAYFMYPAMYLLAARGIGIVGRRRWLRVALVAMLVALSNADLVGLDQLNLWFHYSQGNSW